MLEEWHHPFTQSRHRGSVLETDIQQAVWERYVELTEAYEKFRQLTPTDEDLDKVWANDCYRPVQISEPELTIG